MTSPRLDLGTLKESVEKIRNEIAKTIVGQDKMVELLIIALLSKGHVLIEGFPGLAKTLTAKLLAKSINTKFQRIQFTPDLMPSDILGTTVFNAQDSSFKFKKGPIFSNLVLIDEINRAPAKTQAALFEVMEEKQVTMDGKTYPMSDPYMIIATQNPIDFEGTYRLPEAQMDRFLFRLLIHYPSNEEEIQILQLAHQRKGLLDNGSVNKVLKNSEIKAAQDAIQNVHVDESLLQLIANITTTSRNFRGIEIGASPRGSLAILTASKAKAAIEGRDFVSPDDIIEMAGPVLNHRIILSPEKEMEGKSSIEMITSMIQTLEIPR